MPDFFYWFSLELFPLRKYSAWVSEACLCLLPQYKHCVRYRGLLPFWQSRRQHHLFHWITFISLLFISPDSMPINRCLLAELFKNSIFDDWRNISFVNWTSLLLRPLLRRICAVSFVEGWPYPWYTSTETLG